MKRLAASLFAALLLAPGALPGLNANVVRPAADFRLDGGRTLKSLRGQPVVVVVAPSPRSRAFRGQAKRLEKDYQDLAARNTVFIAAFTEESPAEGLKSSIPFAVARDGRAVAAALGANGPFLLAVIGQDGNLDLATAKVSSGWKVRDAILNNASLQAAERRAQ